MPSETEGTHHTEPDIPFEWQRAETLQNASKMEKVVCSANHFSTNKSMLIGSLETRPFVCAPFKAFILSGKMTKWEETLSCVTVGTSLRYLLVERLPLLR